MHKILIVDDTSDSRDILARLLRRHGMSTITAADGFTALERIADEHPDLVILDLMMPDMDGLQVLQKVRDDPRFHDLPIVMFTAISDETWFSRMVHFGVTDVMIKGATHGEELINRITRLLPHEHNHKPQHKSDA